LKKNSIIKYKTVFNYFEEINFLLVTRKCIKFVAFKNEIFFDYKFITKPVTLIE